MTAIGDVVLLRAEMSADRRQVLVAPGVELATDSVEIVSDVPQVDGLTGMLLLIAFSSKAEFDSFVERLAETHGMKDAA